MVLHGFTLVAMFAPMHECVHRTPFATPRWNEICGWIAGLLAVYNFHFYRRYHTWHHRYTQDPARDPELMPPKAKNLFEYAREIVGYNFWTYRPRTFWNMMTGRTSQWPYVPADARRTIMLSAWAQVSVYVAGAASIAWAMYAGRTPYVLYLWFLPLLLAQPLLRFMLIAEHTACSYDEDGLTNTRTTLASPPVRLLMWNMPYHAEHHLYPSIPFHRLPEAHAALKSRLAHVEPSYPAANRTILRSFGATTESGG
jgi:fatty acid desaturase